MLKRLRQIVFFLFLFQTQLGAHPLHVSITNISLIDNMLYISIRTFADDWETAYYHYHGKETSLSSMNQNTKQWFMLYLTSSLKLSTQKEFEPIVLNLDTVMLEDDAMIINIQAELSNAPNSLYIYNAILTDIFADQTNLLIYSHRKKEKGIRFDFNKKYEEILFR